jgi:hypothetical protein
MQNVQNQETLQSSFQSGPTTSDIESGNGAQGESPQEVNRSTLNTIMIIVSPFVGSVAGALIGHATTSGLSSAVDEPDRELVYLLYIPCVALSALGFGFFTKYLIKKQEGERADNRAEDRNALNNGISSVPDQVGLLSSNGTAHVVGSDLVHVVRNPSPSPVGVGVRSTGSTYTVVGDNPEQNRNARLNFSSDAQVIDLLLDPNKSVFMVPAGAHQDNTTTAVSVPALTRIFSNNITSAKQNTGENKPLVLMNGSDSVRYRVQEIERGRGGEAKSNSRQI